MRIIMIAKNEYGKWFFHSRMLILGNALILMYVMLLQPLKEHAAKIQEPLNYLEGYIGICNSSVFIAFLPAIFLALISDFPKMDCNMIFYLPRCGRKQWILGQFLFLFWADITIIFFVFLGLTIPILDQGFWYDGWSSVITESYRFFEDDSFIPELFPANLFFQMKPFQAALQSTFLIFLYFYFLGCMMMVGKLFGKKILGVILCIFSIVLGSGTAYFNLPFMWFFPTAHSIVAKHYTPYFREMYCQMKTSYLYFFVGISLFAVIAYFKGKAMSFAKISDID